MGGGGGGGAKDVRMFGLSKKEHVTIQQKNMKEHHQ